MRRKSQGGSQTKGQSNGQSDNQHNNGERVTVRVGRNILVAEVVEALNETTLKVRNPASGKEFLTSRARLVPSEPTAPTEPSEQLEPRGPTAVALPKMSLATIAYTVLGRAAGVERDGNPRFGGTARTV